MPSLELPAIYPITDRAISGLSHMEQVRQLIDAGATFIQLREKHLSPRQFYAEAVDAIEVAHHHGVSIIINDRVDIALAANADGVHLGRTDMPPNAARKLLSPDAIIGYSTHSLEQAIDAVTLPVDYIAIGPVFATITKADADPVVGVEGVSAVRLRVDGLPLVAIGGIGAANLRSVVDAGAVSAAIISDLLRGDIGSNMSRLISILT